MRALRQAIATGAVGDVGCAGGAGGSCGALSGRTSPDTLTVSGATPSRKATSTRALRVPAVFERGAKATSQSARVALGDRRGARAEADGEVAGVRAGERGRADAQVRPAGVAELDRRGRAGRGVDRLGDRGGRRPFDHDEAEGEEAGGEVRLHARPVDLHAREQRDAPVQAAGGDRHRGRVEAPGLERRICAAAVDRRAAEVGALCPEHVGGVDRERARRVGERDPVLLDRGAVQPGTTDRAAADPMRRPVDVLVVGGHAVGAAARGQRDERRLDAAAVELRAPDRRRAVVGPVPGTRPGR